MSGSLTSGRVAGIDLLVRGGAADQTVLLLHGIGGRASSFAQIMKLWPAGPRLLAWDQPGYGNSKPHPAAWPKARDYAASLDDVRSALGLTNFDVIGQSLGALIAAAYARQYSKHVRRLVLMSPAHGYGIPRNGVLPATLTNRIRDFDNEGAAAFAAKRAPRLIHGAERKPDVVSAVRAAMATLSNPGHTQAVRLLGSGTLLEDAVRLPHEIHLISGAHDLITPIDGTSKLHEALNARFGFDARLGKLQLVSDAGHAVYLEAPDEVVDSMTAFLEAPS